jgi:transcriptional regulator with XRE-family HTH domain
MTQAAFAKRVGSAQANVSKWENEGRQPEAKPMGEMAVLAGVTVAEFSDVLWQPSGFAEPKQPPSLEDVAAEHGWVLIDEIDLAFGMGATFLDSDRAPERLGLVPFAADWIRDMYRGSITHLKVVRGRGDSMEPTIRDGDFVLIDTSRRRLDEQDVVWAVSYGELGMIRRLRQMPGGGVQLMPDNSVVRPTEAYDGEMHIMGRVIWIGRRM